jgi:hypothetical protein
MNVYLGHEDTLYVDRGAGPIDVLREHGAGVVFVLPDSAVDLMTADEAASAVIEQVRQALAAIKMSAKARDEVGRALDDLEPADS